MHACDAVSMGFNRVLGRCRDTDVLLPLVYFLGTIKDIETWMIVGTAHTGACKCYKISQRCTPVMP